MTRIAFLGLGAMGSRMAVNLFDAGFDLTVWNRNPSKTDALGAKGARVAGSPRAAATDADIVFCMVRDDVASARVWLDPESGAFGAMRNDAIAIESSTLTLSMTKRLASEAGARGIAFLDAPVAGSRPQAETRQLIHIVGGDEAALALAEPALKAIGAAIHHVGASGAGMAMKLGINTLFGVQVAALAEIFGILTKQGVDGARAAEIIAATPTASPAAKGAMATMVAGAYAPQFPVDLVAKDFAYVLASAHDTKSAAPVTQAAHDVFKAAQAQGFGEEHLTATRKLYG